jgi:hypothetical protein
VTNDAPSVRRKSVGPTISSFWPIRLSTVFFERAAMNSEFAPWMLVLGKGPGVTQLNRIPFGP